MTSNDFNNPNPYRDDARHTPVDPVEPGIEPQPPIDQPPAIFSQEPTVNGYLPRQGQDESQDQDSEAKQVARDAADSAQELAKEGQESATAVMDTAKAEASMVAEQAKDKAANLFEELGGDVREQASVQQQKVAANLRDISGEFRNMLDNSQSSGTASMLVDQAAQHSGNVAQWLESREPGDLLNEVKDFARKRPGAFLGIALGAGLLAGRITRNASGAKNASSATGTGSPDHLASTGSTPAQGVPVSSPSPVDASLGDSASTHAGGFDPLDPDSANRGGSPLSESGLTDPLRPKRITEFD